MSNVPTVSNRRFGLTCLGLLAAVITPLIALAQEVSPSPLDEPHEAQVQRDVERHGRRHGNAVVSVGRDSVLQAGERADAVVSVLGSSTSEGEVRDAVVSIMGDTRVTGPVGEAAVAVMGSLYINSKIGGDAVAVLGDVELGPEAEIGGDVVAVGGTLQRDPAAVIHGNVERVAFGGLPDFGWFKAWVKQCLMYGRPLALGPGLGWAWAVALSFLALYVLLALFFKGAVDRCVHTLESQPGRSILAALLMLIFTPVAIVLLLITVVGIVVVPFFGIALFCAGLFGKTVILAALGRRITRHAGDTGLGHTAVAVLVGGVLVLALYLVPVLGFIVYKVLGILGLGVVAYTLLLVTKDSRLERAAVPPLTSPGSTPPQAAPGEVHPAQPQTVTSESFASEAAQTQSAQAQPMSPAATAGQQTSEAQAPAAATALERAGFWIRMAALAIDSVLIGVLFAFFSDFGEVDLDRIWLLALATYGAIMWKLKATTIGGIVLGLQVVRVDGRSIDWGTAIVRALGCFLSLIVLGLGFIWIVFDEGKQAWHDKIAGTAVVRAPKGISLV